MKNFFQRDKTDQYKEVISSYFERLLNIDNLANINKRKVLSLYDKKLSVDFLAYRFDLLKAWMEANKAYSKEYIVMLDQIIDKLWLSNELNSFEQQYIKNIQAIVFAKNRNLKQLIVDFSVNKGELVFYRYDVKHFIQKKKNKIINKIDNFEIFITTQRIILSKDIDIVSIRYDEIISSIRYSRSGIFFTLENGCVCELKTDNNRELFESFKRVLSYAHIKSEEDE